MGTCRGSQGLGTKRLAALPLLMLITSGAVAAQDAPEPGADAPAAPAGQALDLDTARRTARERSPELQASLAGLRAQEAQADQARRPPNPELSVEVENVAGSGPFAGTDLAETTVALVQPLEIGGKRVRRRELGERRVALASGQHALEERALDARVTRAFASALAAQRREALADELVRETEALVARVERRASGNGAREADRTRAHVALGQARVEQAQARAQHASARVRLAAASGSESEIRAPLAGELSRTSEPPPLEQLLAAADAAPRLASSADRVALQRAALQLERARRLPDVSVKAGYRRLSGVEQDAAVFGLAVPLPLFHHNAGEFAAARHELEGALRDRHSARLSVLADLAIAYESLASAFYEIHTAQQEVLPEAQRALAETQRAFARGHVAFLDLFNAHRTYFRAREDLIEALERYHHAVADVEELIDADIGPDL